MSNENGQNSFPIPEGEIIIRISGGQYYPVELSITVTSQGIDDNQGLPGDRDGDGYGDLLDAFPDDVNEWVDTDLDNIGDNADTDDDGDGLLDQEEIISNPQTNPLKPDSDSDGYCDGPLSIIGVCVSGDKFPIDSSEWADTDSDGVGDNADQCPDTSANEPIDEYGCSASQLDDGIDNPADDLDQNNTDVDSSNQDKSDSKESTSNSLLIVGGSIALIIVLAVLALLMLLRNRGDEIDEKQFVQQEELFENVAIATTTPYLPTKPPVTARGEMHQGYEAIEFPAGSGSWFYRDPDSGAWVEWR